MTIHELKVWPQYFNATRNGEKRFELRRNDRDFRVGDHLLLKEWDPYARRGQGEPYTGRSILVRVDYIMDDAHRFGLDPDYIIMSISHVN